MTESRKLAAILAADVVGFSRLTGADEDRTLARLRALRSDLIDPTIAVRNGRVVKRTGDGSLIWFRSVVDAVRCAIEVQSGVIERNAGRCHIGVARARSFDASGKCQAAATAVRHVVIASARSARCVSADTRWRWTLKVL